MCKALSKRALPIRERAHCAPDNKDQTKPSLIPSFVVLRRPGGPCEEPKPDPIPNSAVKLLSANGTVSQDPGESVAARPAKHNEIPPHNLKTIIKIAANPVISSSQGGTATLSSVSEDRQPKQPGCHSMAPKRSSQGGAAALSSVSEDRQPKQPGCPQTAHKRSSRGGAATLSSVSEDRQPKQPGCHSTAHKRSSRGGAAR